MKTVIPVNTDDAAAFCATPPRLLIFDKGIDTDRSDILKVLEHAHPVFRPVSFVQLLQSFTGVVLAFVTEFRLTVRNIFTVFNDASHAGRRFGGIIPAAAGAFSLLSQVSKADTTIHSAWSNKLGSCRHDYTSFAPGA